MPNNDIVTHTHNQPTNKMQNIIIILEQNTNSRKGKKERKHQTKNLKKLKDKKNKNN